VAYHLSPDAPWPGLFYYDAATGAWPAVANRYERQRGQLAAHLDHFTLFAIAANPAEFEFDPGPRVRGAQPQLFSGSIGYTYPFALPPGRGGLTPQLGLIYSSSRHRLHTGHFSLAGIGWDILGENYVSRDPSAPGSNPITLALNGATYTISTATWRAKEDPYIVVSRLVDPGSPRIIEITTRDGTRYSFKGVAYTDSTADLTGDAAPMVYKWENC
jgi:hypothetical protein